MKVVHVLRKPLVGSVAENVLEHGAGALHINACRLSSKGAAFGNATGRHGGQLGGGGDNSHSRGRWEPTAGRWPPNLILQHLPACRCTGSKRVQGTRQGSSRYTALGMMNDDGWEPQTLAREAPADADGMETVEAWDCVPGCPVRDLEEDVGVTSTGRMDSIAQEQTDYESFGKCYTRRVVAEGSKGFVTRFFKQVGGDDG